MNVTVVGTGYVGLVTGTCFSEFGIDVVCVDNDAEKSDMRRNGVIPIFEPGLNQVVRINRNAERLKRGHQRGHCIGVSHADSTIWFFLSSNFDRTSWISASAKS